MAVFHIELRQFPHNHCRFNMSEQELMSVVVKPWARGEWIDLGERKWSPQMARLRVLDGPQLAVGDLAMGRGWRNAERKSREVTDELLATVAERQPVAPPTTASQQQQQPSQDLQLLGDSLGLELLGRLAGEAVALSSVWRLAQERHPERSASDCLAIAERTVRALLDSRLIVLLQQAQPDLQPVVVDQAELEPLMFAADSWIGDGPAAVSLRRV
ncbi:MAG TPA: hypothetical protein VLJ42_01195 [Solirubrobacteraceae bacterium]|nr:hypothetical protein [Solirubrobacteraceae bacterium]